MHNKYPWAVNPVKLQQSVESLTKQKNYDPKIVIDEKAVKIEYVRRGGLLPEYRGTRTIDAKGNARFNFPNQPTIAEIVADIEAEFAPKEPSEPVSEISKDEVLPKENKKIKRASKDE